MGLIHTIKVKLKRKLHDFIWKMADLSDLEDQVHSTTYFVQKTIDPKSIPLAVGPLRDLQLCDLQLLRIFHEVCRKQGWTYWLDYGTFLGSVRHGGFIPWDDDLDVSVPREVYSEMLEKMPGLVKKYGIDVEDDPDFPMSRLCFSYKHHDTGIWLDIFPVDSRVREKNVYEGFDDLAAEMDGYREFYKAKHADLSRDELIQKRESMIHNQENGEYRLMFIAPEFDDGNHIFDYNHIFPLRTISFEGFSFHCPGDSARFLTQVYGSDFMSLPAKGVESHGSESGALSTWAAKSHTDMKEILKELTSVADGLSKE